MTLHEGDCLDVLAGMPDASVDAVVTDPPYSIAFMGRSWDTFTPAEFQAWCEKWAAECLRVLKPGGHLLAFGGTRTYHRLVSGIEDAGFEIRESLHWLYGSGFPKGKACLKPSHEPIVLARKSAGRMVPLNIDSCRVGTTRGVPASHSKTAPSIGVTGIGARRTPAELDPNVGRWPPNVLLAPEAAEELDRQAPATGSFLPPGRRYEAGQNKAVYSSSTGHGTSAHDAPGGASRFFPVFRYEAKASSRERPRLPDGTAWPTVKPVELLRWLVRLVTPPGGLVLDPFAGTGTTAEAAILEGFRCVLIERDPAAVALTRQRLAKPLQPSLTAEPDL